MQLRLPPKAVQALTNGAEAVEWVVERVEDDLVAAAEAGDAVRGASTFYVPR